MAENIQIKINAAVDSAQAATTIGQLRKSLIELQDIAENNDLGAEQFQALQAQIVSTNTDLANARDRIGDIQDKISTLQGTPIERVRNSFGLLREAIFNLDFDKARIGVEGLANAFTPLGPDGMPLKGLAAMRGALTNLTGAASQLGTTFINLGRTLLTNPIFLLATVITTITVGIVLLLNKLGLLQPLFDLIGKAVEYVTDSFNQLTEAIGLNTAATDKNLKATLAAEQQKRKAIEDTFKYQESVANAVKDLNSREQLEVEKLSGVYVRQSETISAVRIEALTKIKLSLQDEIKAYDNVAKSKRKLTDDEKKSYDEIVLKIQETNARIVALQAERVRETNEINDRVRMNTITMEKNDYKRAQLLRDEEIRQAGKNYDLKVQLLEQEKAAKEEVKAKEVFAASEAGRKEFDLAVANAKKIRDQINAISNEELQLKIQAEEKYNSTVRQLNNDFAREQQDKSEANIKLNLDRIKSRQQSELALNEGFEIKQLEIKNKYIKLIEEFQLNNAKFFFKTEESKQAFLDENTKDIKINEQKINEIIIARNNLITEQQIKEKEATLLAELQNNKKLEGAELELATLRVNLTVLRDSYDLQIAQAKTQEEKNAKEAEAQLKIAEIKRQIRDIDEEAIKTIQNEKNLEIQRELNALETLLANQIKFDQEKLKSRKDVIDFVKNLEGKSEEELKALRTASANDQIDLLNKIKTVKEEQIANDELTLQLEKSNIQDFTDFQTQLQDLSANEQREFNASRLENEKTTSDAVIAIRQEEARQKEEIEERQKQFIINTATTTISALQTISDIFYAGRLRKVQGNAVEEEKIARKQFQVNKALNLSTATMTGIVSVMEAYKNGLKNPIPLLGPLTGTVYAGLAAAVSAINIAKIAATTFNSKGGAASAGSAPTQNINGSTPTTTALPSTFTAPTFFGLGEGTQQTMVGPNQQRVYVVETDITSTQNRVAVIENRSVIQ